MSKRFFFLIILFFSLQSCTSCFKQSNIGEKSFSGTVELYRDSLSIMGYPIISDSIPSQLLVRKCYTVSYNQMTKQPNWVMWKLTTDRVVPRKEGVWNEYHEDLDIALEERSINEDYALSGFDRGHMCPGGDCNWDDIGRDETFLLSNMCPQNPNLNRGDWKEIEIACRKWAQKYGTVYIVCGPIFLRQEHITIGENLIPVPEAFFKVVLAPDCYYPKGIGFICRNTDGNRKKDFYVNSIRQVERITGYKFFPMLNDSIKQAIYNNDDINVW